MTKTDLKQLIVECILEETDTLPQTVELKRRLYDELKRNGFRELGEEPRSYMEFYVFNSLTLQVSVDPEQQKCRVELYYDSEMLADKNGWREYDFNSASYDKLLKNILTIKQKIAGAEATDGGLDDF
jgi:hypothetical protein